MRKAFIAVCLLALGIALIPIARVGYHIASDAWFYFGPSPKPDFSHLERIVELVRQAGVAPGETKQFMVDDVVRPKVLTSGFPTIPEPAKSRRCPVWAERSADGNLKVVIESAIPEKKHHVGFATSDTPLASEGSTDWLVLDLPGPLIYSQKTGLVGILKDRWWMVETHPSLEKRADLQAAKARLKAEPAPGQ